MKVVCCKYECIRNTCTKVVKCCRNKASSLTEVVFKHFLIEDDSNRKVFDAFEYEASHENMQRMSIIYYRQLYRHSVNFGWISNRGILYMQQYWSTLTLLFHINQPETKLSEPQWEWDIRHLLQVCVQHRSRPAISIISATGLIIYIVGLVSLKLFNGISCRKLLSIILHLIVIMEILAFATVLGYLQQQRIIGLLKMIGMGIMVSSTCIVFAWDEFSKIKKTRVKPNNRKWL